MLETFQMGQKIARRRGAISNCNREDHRLTTSNWSGLTRDSGESGNCGSSESRFQAPENSEVVFRVRHPRNFTSLQKAVIGLWEVC